MSTSYSPELIMEFGQYRVTAQEGDGGQYQCKVSNSVGSNVASHLLNLYSNVSKIFLNLTRVSY